MIDKLYTFKKAESPVEISLELLWKIVEDEAKEREENSKMSEKK